MGDMKNYQPEPIPARTAVDAVCTKVPKQADKEQERTSDSEKFAEIVLNTCNSGVAVPVPQNIPSAPDEKRTLFYEMRKIARQDMSFIGNPSKIFYYQAQMMQDFTDDFQSQVPFSFYYPYYQLMGYGQLRTYFTWRTKVRAGDIQSTSVSYVFMYIYELLACIGERDSETSLQKLMHLWQIYRKWDKTIDKYIIQWIKDFHIYYPLKKSFSEFASENNLEKYYPKVFLYTSERENSFDLYSSISKYDVRKSIFFTDETEKLISDCFYFLLWQLRKMCKARNIFFEDFVFYPVRREMEWKPFAGALFYPYLEQKDHTVALSEREVYTCRKNRWTYRSVILNDTGKGLVGYIMKEMESVLRKKLHYRYKINASPDMYDASLRKKMERLGINLPLVISKGVSEFLAVYNRKPVHIDTESVSRIRMEALKTQEKLIVAEDEEADTVVVHNPIQPPALHSTATADEDVWHVLGSSFTTTEQAALQAVLQGQSVKSVADAHGIMLEVLLDGINEKSMDAVGDALLEIDETVTVYDEYKEKLMELMGC